LRGDGVDSQFLPFTFFIFHLLFGQQTYFPAICSFTGAGYKPGLHGAVDFPGMLLTRHLQRQSKALTRIASPRPAYAAAVRGTLATIGPILFMHLLEIPGGAFVGLGGFLTTLADKGGAYRNRAILTGSTAFFGAAAAALGAVVGVDWRLALAVMFLVIFLTNYLRVWGPDAGTIGSLCAVIFVVSLASPATSPHDVWQRALWLMAGGTFSIFLSLVAWPLRVYHPARVAVGTAYTSLSNAARTLVRLAVEDSDRELIFVFQQQCAVVRADIESARAVLASIGRAGESSRGARLIVAIEAADQIFGTLIMLGDLLDAWRERGESATLNDAREIAEGVAGFCDDMAAFVQSDFPTSAALAAQRQLVTTAKKFTHFAEEFAENEEKRPRLRALARRFVTYASAATEGAKKNTDLRPNEQRPRFAPWQAVMENFSRDSVVLRHASRTAVAAAIAFSVAAAFDLPRGYWMTLAVIVILQPYTDATVLKGLQRVIGTIAGGLVAAAIGSVVHGPLVIIGIIAILIFISLAVLPVNYTLYSFFLTPTFVLLAEVNAGDWHLVQIRIVNTLIGGAIALAAASFLWPRSEHKGLASALATALRKNARYLEAIGRLHGAAMEQRRELRNWRREVGIALIDAETSLERLLSESAEPHVEALKTLTLYARRISISLAALSTAWTLERDALQTFAQRAVNDLEAIAAAVEARATPPPLTIIVGEDAPPPFDRLMRQIEVLSNAAGRAGS
jgi:uncharacterized membrane protein YccC